MAIKSINLRLDEEAHGRLEALARKAGKTKTGIIRQLIMGRSLGDRTGRQVLAKLSQLGGLLAHCATELRDKDEGMGQFVVIGNQIREMALTLSIKDDEDEDAQETNDRL